MTDTERIDLVLKKVAAGSPAYFDINEILKSAGDTEEYAYKRISDRIKSENLAEIIEENRVRANTNTFIIEGAGGYTIYFEQIQKGISKKNEIENTSNEKLKNEAKLSKWQVKAFWPAFGFAVFGFFYSVFSIVYSSIGESETEKINRIVKKEVLLQQQQHNTLMHEHHKDTLSIYKNVKN